MSLLPSGPVLTVREFRLGVTSGGGSTSCCLRLCQGLAGVLALYWLMCCAVLGAPIDTALLHLRHSGVKD